MCYILCFVIYGMVVFTYPTDPGVQVLPFLSAENGGKTLRAFSAAPGSAPGVGSPSLAPSPSRAVPAWPPSHATATTGWDGGCWSRRNLPSISPMCFSLSIYLRQTTEGCPSPSAPSFRSTHLCWSRASYTDDKAMNYPCPVTKPEMCHNSSVNELKRKK